MLTPQQKEEIRAKRAAGERVKELSNQYGVSPQRITQIVHYQPAPPKTHWKSHLRQLIGDLEARVKQLEESSDER